MLCGHAVPFSETWPTSFTTLGGRLYPLPMRERRTDVSECSSSPGLLPTPAAGNFNDGESLESWEARRQANLAKGINGNGQGTPLAIAAQQLLPTPQEFDSHFDSLNISDEAAERQLHRTDGIRRNTTGSLTKDLLLLKTPTAQLAVNGGSQHPDKRRQGGHGPTLADQVEHQLLPTPRATDGTHGGPNQRGSSGDLMLPSAVIGLLPTPRASDTGTPGRRASEGFRPPLSQVLLPTPMAADGDRMSTTMPRGNPTLIGALTALPSAAGSGQSDGQLLLPLSPDEPASA